MTVTEKLLSSGKYCRSLIYEDIYA